MIRKGPFTFKVTGGGEIYGGHLKTICLLGGQRKKIGKVQVHLVKSHIKQQKSIYRKMTENLLNLLRSFYMKIHKDICIKFHLCE